MTPDPARDGAERLTIGFVARAAWLVLLLSLSFTTSAHAQLTLAPSRPKSFEVWVHAELGDDANPGTAAQPLRTLNRALGLAWQARHPNAGKGVKTGHIKVLFSQTPIAPGATPDIPNGFGGNEPVYGGWLTPQERRAGCVRTAFPIRMVEGIDIIGVATGTRKPVITIDEQTAGVAWRAWTKQGPCNPVVIQSAVLAASDARLQGFVIDGRKLIDTSKSRFPGLRVAAASGAEITGCDILGWHDQVDVDPGGSQFSSEVVFRNCVMSDSWPINLGGGPDLGHAAMWIRGPGDCKVALEGCTFARSHDAVEIAVENSRAEVLATNCQIVDNENGFEVVGNGIVKLEVLGCEFVDNYNRDEGGTPSASALVAGMAFRGNVFVDCKVRRSLFRNNTVGVLWQVQAPSIMDLGASKADPGLNSFCLDYCIFPPGEDVFGACIVQRSSGPGTSPGVIMAVGNAWLPNNQGATGMSSRRMFGRLEGVVEPLLPFPGFGCAGPGGEYPRQYTSQDAGALIVFDTKTMPAPMQLGTCADCETTDCP